MNKKTLAIGVSILLGVLTLAVASALTQNIVAGEPYLLTLPEEYDYYSIVGNSTPINITNNGLTVIIITNKYSPADSFEIIFFNKEKEVIIEHHYSSGSSRTKYVDRNITVEKEVDKIIYVNQTEEPEPSEPEEKESFLWVYMLCSFIAGIVLMLFFRLFKKSKEGKKNEK